MDLQLAGEQGKQVSRPPLEVQLPDLEKLMEHFHQMKHEKMEAWSKNHAAKMAKLDELIKAVQGIKLEGGGSSKDSEKLAQILLQIKKEHSTVTAEHKALKEVAHVHENCNYRVTGRRDQRGLIDLEHGLLFEVVRD
jgi:hypothetical protein